MEEAARTRLALMKAALMAFEVNGWRGATFDDVSRRAGVTRGALHHHFRDKAALLVESLTWGWSEYGAQLFAVVDGDDDQDTAHRLRMLIATYVQLLSDDELFRALASTTVLVAPHTFDKDDDKSSALDEWRMRIAEVITADPLVRSQTPPAEIAGLVLVLLQGFTVTAVTRPYDLPSPQHLDAAITGLVAGLLTQPKDHWLS